MYADMDMDGLLGHSPDEEGVGDGDEVREALTEEDVKDELQDVQEDLNSDMDAKESENEEEDEEQAMAALEEEHFAGAAEGFVARLQAELVVGQA
ncbi:unnamed protein product [Rhizoctonia solani]|uniref:Uncharacterized protein n=1 Tax=Rhizoctonia solani TaxID=456999 RepID=A0A8H3GPM7_9AGAM|nr:unnamed protein product [Rhizoctonia solani]